MRWRIRRKMREILWRNSLPREVKEVRDLLLRGEIPRDYSEEHIKMGLLEAVKIASKRNLEDSVAEALKKDEKLRKMFNSLLEEAWNKEARGKIYGMLISASGSLNMITALGFHLVQPESVKRDIYGAAGGLLLGIGLYLGLKGRRWGKISESIERIKKKVEGGS